MAARRNGVAVEEFGIFFPPTLYRHKTKAGWIFSINLLPLGGFVKLKGEHDSDTQSGAYGAAGLWAKTKIMAAGVIMNLVVALVLLTILALIGLPEIVNNQFKIKGNTTTVTQRVLVGNVEANSPAAKAGLKTNDELTAIGKTGQKPIKVTSTTNLPGLTSSLAGDKVNIYYARDGVSKVATTTLLSSQVVQASQKAYSDRLAHTKLDCTSVALPKGYLGVSSSDYSLQRSTWSAPVVAVGFSAQATALTFEGLGHAIGGLGSLVAGAATGNSVARSNGQCSASSQVTGPVGIFMILKDSSQLGFDFMLFLIAVISLTLAIMNILPIPALDGGRLWLTLIMHGLKKPLTAKREETINAVGMFVLLSLFVLITIVDVHRFF